MMQNEILALIPRYLPMGIIIYDKEGKLKYLNAVALDMFGTTIEKVYNINLFDDPNIGHHDKAKLKQWQDISFETDYDFDRCRQFYDSEFVHTHKYFVTKITIMRDEHDQPQGYLLNCEDVTQKKAQQQQLLDSYKRVELMQRELALALDAGMLTSWDYQISTGKLSKFTGSPQGDEQWSFESIRDRVHPHDRNAFLGLLDLVAHGQHPSQSNLELRVRNINNEEYRHYNFVYNVREDENGNPAGITFIQRDITEDVIYRENLIRAKNRAEEADKLKSTFLASMSHEIRTPLNSIVGFSQLLSDANDADEKREYKRLIDINSEILLKLIGDILDLSKIEAGSIDILRKPLNLNHLTNELYQSFKQRLTSPNVTMRLVDPYAHCVAQMDMHRFIQVFTNFVTNAIKYTPQGEIVMGYECSPGRVRLYVRDTGIGIPDKKRERIFGRFEKLDDFAQGTGLGLSICKAIADVTGAEIGFSSQENVGSEFWFIVHTQVDYTLKSAPGDTDKDPVVVAPEAKMHKHQVKDLNILVAEDNDSNYLLLKTILKDNNLTRAINGAEAVEKAKTQTFDIIFMDMKMPVMNGLEATALIRQFTTTPIVALTANAFNADRDEALAAGCNHFMTKPVNVDELMELLSGL
ncbi:MAG: response regulator [Mucinivorans sp.]